MLGFNIINAQVLNNFTIIYNVSGTSIYVNGSLFNAPAGIIKMDASSGVSSEIITFDYTNNGQSSGKGIYRVNGNWFNNNLFFADSSTVFLSGANQIVGGNIPTQFYNLNLTGTGIKTQSNHQFILNVLNLNDVELNTDSFTMFVINTSLDAILRTTGFVSSIDTGTLSRKTALNQPYLFPVGSSLGTIRYRPVEIEPLTADTIMFQVRMANVDATVDGYDRGLLHYEICSTTPLFYHRINRLSANIPAKLTVFFDEVEDGLWDGLAYWDVSPPWLPSIASTVLSSTPLSRATVSNWNIFNNTPFILYAKNVNLNLGADTVICGSSMYNIDAGLGFDSYVWSTSDTTQSIQVTSSGIYSVTVTKGNCTAADTISVTLNPLPLIDLGNDTTICEGILYNIDAGLSFESYLWNNGDTLPAIGITTAGTYSVTVSDMYGCQNYDSITITTISYNASIDTVGNICSDASPLILTAADTGGVWSGIGITDAVNGIFDPVIAGIGAHLVTYAISIPCGDTGTAIINVINCSPYEPHAVVPDAFSPNGDGENDILYVRGEGIKTINFSIYTRWGEKVFNTENKKVGWDGTYKEKDMDPAVFVYQLDVVFENDEKLKLKGEVTLVR